MGRDRGSPRPQGGRGDHGGGGRTSFAGRSSPGNMRGRMRSAVWREKTVQVSEGSGSRKRVSEEAELDLQDTASSPTKPIKEGDTWTEKPSAQKHLNMEHPPSIREKDVPPLPPQYVSPREKKRMKKAADKEAATSPTKSKAASQREDRQT